MSATDPRELIRELAEALRLELLGHDALSHDLDRDAQRCPRCKRVLLLRRAEAWLAEPASGPVWEFFVDPKQPDGSYIPDACPGCAQRDATLAEVRAELRVAADALTDHGYRRSCDTPACNCGFRWAHGGHAATRLREIDDALGDHRQGRTILGAVQIVVADRDRLGVELAEAQRELNEASDATGLAGVDEPLSLLDAVRVLRQERDAAQAALVLLGGELVEAQAALAQAQRDALLWAADQINGFVYFGDWQTCRTARCQLANRIARGPQPAERGED